MNLVGALAVCAAMLASGAGAVWAAIVQFEAVKVFLRDGILPERDGLWLYALMTCSDGTYASADFCRTEHVNLMEGVGANIIAVWVLQWNLLGTAIGLVVLVWVFCFAAIETY